MTGSYNAKELLKKYSSPGEREVLLDLRALSIVLKNCVVSPSYKPSSELVDALSFLSDEGIEARKIFASGHITKPKGRKGAGFNAVALSNLYALLELVNKTPLLDLTEVSPKRIAEAIAQEVLEKEIRLPFTHGRELYDLLNGVQRKEVRYLENVQALEILDSAPIGVVHAGRFLIGPLGLVETPFRRSLYGDVSPHLQHSADRTTGRPHRVVLQTSELSEVNAKREEYRGVLRRISRDRSDWDGFFSGVLTNQLHDFDERSTKTMSHFIGEVFSDAELGSLLLEASEVPSLSLIRAVISERVAGPVTEESLGTLDRGELTQALLTVSDHQLWEVIQNAVEKELVKVPSTEIRRPVLKGSYKAGQWGISLELGNLGLRTVSAWPEMPFLRLTRLSQECWDKCGKDYQQDIEWAIRGEASGRGFGRVLRFLDENPVPEVVRILFTMRTSALEVCKDHLRIRIYDSDTDDLIVAKIMWALGFHLEPNLQVVSDFNASTSQVITRLRNLPLEGISDQDLREATSGYPAAAERYVRGLLAYLTWVLLEDHYTTDRPFTYTSERAARFADETLYRDTSKRLEDMTLGQFSDRMKQLLNLLRKKSRNPRDYERPQEEYPAFATRTELQRFPLKYRPLFLNLARPSQERILQILEQFTDTFVNSGVVRVRRELVHDSGKELSREDTLAAIETFRNAIENLEPYGLSPAVAVRSRTVEDRWGRLEIEYVVDHDIDRVQRIPSPYGFLGQPLGAAEVMIIPAAYFGEEKEPLVFGYSTDSEYRTYWADFPVRPVSGEIVEGES